VVTGAGAVRAFLRGGFEFQRQSSSHVILFHPARLRTVSVPVHAGRMLSAGLTRELITQSGLSVDEFRRLLK
jgi:predicted RNA binding protein YcfA (HicA-like mRNA interferase family)